MKRIFGSNRKERVPIKISSFLAFHMMYYGEENSLLAYSGSFIRVGRVSFPYSLCSEHVKKHQKITTTSNKTWGKCELLPHSGPQQTRVSNASHILSYKIPSSKSSHTHSSKFKVLISKPATYLFNFHQPPLTFTI